MTYYDLADTPVRPARSRVLRLRGLPYRALADDITLFLSPWRVTRVQICRHNGGHGLLFIYQKYSTDKLSLAGRTTGEAHVQFNNRHEAGQALRTKNCQYLANRYIE